MWKKLYSNSGLILLAILAAGVWTSNLYTFIRQSPKPSSTAEAQTAPDVRELGRRVKAKYPEYNDLSDEEVGRRVKAKFPGAYDDFTDTSAAQLSPTPTPRKSAEEILGIAPSPSPHFPVSNSTNSEKTRNLSNVAVSKNDSVSMSLWREPKSSCPRPDNNPPPPPSAPTELTATAPTDAVLVPTTAVLKNGFLVDKC